MSIPGLTRVQGDKRYVTAKPLTWLCTHHRGAANDNQIERLFIGSSVDGQVFGTIDADYTPVSGHTVRDPEPLWHNGVLYVAHASGSFGASTSFDVCSWDGSTVNATDGRPTFLVVATVDMSSVATGATPRVWAPAWFVDTDGSVHVTVGVSTGGSAGPFQSYEVHPTNAGMTSWSTPVAISGLPSNYLDLCIVKNGSTYHAFYKEFYDSNSYIEHATATALTGPYTVTQSGNTLGLGPYLEAPTVVPNPTGGWSLFVDYFQGATTYRADSADLTSWSNFRACNTTSPQPRHMGVITAPPAAAIPIQKAYQAGFPVGNAGGVSLSKSGLVVPAQGGYAVSTGNTPAAQAGRLVRFVPHRDMTVTAMAYHVLTAASSSDSLDLRLWDAGLNTIAQYIGVPASAGVVNSTGHKVQPFSAAVRLRAGQPYYASLAYGTIGGASAANLVSFKYNGINTDDTIGAHALVSKEIGQVECLYVSSLYNTTQRIEISSAQVANIGFLLAVLE